MDSITDSPTPGQRVSPDHDVLPAPYGSTNTDIEPGPSPDDGPPLSFADLGIPTGPQLHSTSSGKIRKLGDIDRLEVVFLALSSLALLGTVIFTIYKLATINKTQTDFVFAIVLLVNSAFCVFYLFHGVLKERPYEIFILVAVTISIILYLVINYAEGIKGTVKLVRMIAAIVLGPFVVSLGSWIGHSYLQSGNLVFRTVGASGTLQSMCRTMFLFLDLLKLDLQLGITMVILIMVNGVNITTRDIVILVIGGIITVGWFILGHFAVRRESKIMTYCFWGLGPLELAYIVYKVVKAAGRLDVAPALAACSLTAGVLASIVRVAVIVLTFFVYRNYDKGLKEKAFGIEQK